MCGAHHAPQCIPYLHKKAVMLILKDVKKVIVTSINT